MAGASLSWRLARDEIRLRPARFAATALATTIALAFLIATQVFLATQTHAVKQRSAIWASQADVVLQTHLWSSWRSQTDRDHALQIAETTLAHDPTVTAVSRFSRVRSLLTHGSTGADVMLTSTVPQGTLQWLRTSQGRLPQSADEVALTQQVADSLHARVGDTIAVSRISAHTLTVVGVTDDGGYSVAPAYVDLSFFARDDLVFVPNPPGTIPRPDLAAQQTPGSNGDGPGIDLLVSTSDPAGTVARVQAALTDQVILKAIAQPRLATDVVDEAAAASAGGVGWLPYVVTGAAVLALGVGALTITSTYRMLVTARRRQIALLRSVGAHRSQAAGWLIAESALLWLAAAAVSVPVGLAGAWVAVRLSPGTDAWGLVIPAARIAWSMLAALVVSVLAALGPAWQASRVAPLEALSHVALPPTTRSRHRAGVVSGGLVLCGLVGVVVGLTGRGTFWTTIGAAVALTIGCLLAMSSVGAWFARLSGRLARRPVAVVAAANVARNPGRTGSAIVAMLVPLLVFTALLAGAQVGRSGASARLDQLYPVDLSLASAKLDPDPIDQVNGQVDTGSKDSDGFYLGFNAGALDEVVRTPGVRDAAMFRTTQPVTILAKPGLFSVLPIAEITPRAASLSRTNPALADGELGLPTSQMRDLQLRPGDRVDLLPVLGVKQRVTVVERNLGPDVAAVNPATFAKLQMTSKDGLMLVDLDATASTDTTLVQAIMTRLLPENPALAATGNVQAMAQVNARIDSVVRLVTTLLAIVSVVGLVSVATILGLAVLERTRESALLRALGTSRGGVRTMVAVESVLLAVVSSVVAVALGWLLGWAGGEALLGRLGLPSGGLAGTADTAPLLAAGVAVTLVTAIMASVVPGIIASRATPVEALADLG